MGRVIGLTFDAPGPQPETGPYEGLKAAELDELLDARGIERPAKLTNAQRVELLLQADAASAAGACETPQGA